MTRWNTHMRRVGLVVVALAAIVGASCNDPVETPIRPEVVTTPVILSINIIGNQVDSTTLQLSAFGERSDGTIEDVTTRATWSSSNSAVATVDVNGLVVAVGNGSAEIRASLEGVVGVFPLNVAGL